MAKVREDAPLEQKIGEALQKRNIRTADLMRLWDKEKNGEIPKTTFVDHVKGMVHAVAEAEIASLFDEVDGTSHPTPAWPHHSMHPRPTSLPCSPPPPLNPHPTPPAFFHPICRRSQRHDVPSRDETSHQQDVRDSCAS